MKTVLNTAITLFNPQNAGNYASENLVYNFFVNGGMSRDWPPKLPETWHPPPPSLLPLSNSQANQRVSMGWWLLRLSAKILVLLRLSGNFFQLRLTKKLKINFFCFKELNINKPVFFVSLKQNKGLRIISGWNKLFFWKILTFDRSYFL